MTTFSMIVVCFTVHGFGDRFAFFWISCFSLYYNQTQEKNRMIFYPNSYIL